MTTCGPLVYLVDDDPAVLRGFARLLHAWGYRTRTFASSQELLNGFTNDIEAPDCLLLDVHMPGLSGVELLTHLTEAEASLPVVFLSGHMDATMRATSIGLGVVDFLQKPVGAGTLLPAVERAVHRRQGRLHA